MIKAAAAEQLPVVHPEQPGFAGITIGQLSGPAHDPANTMRNVVTVSTGTLDWDAPVDVDRRDRPLAVRHRHVARGWRCSTRRAGCALGEDFRHEGILGTVFTGRLVEETHGRRAAGGRAARSPAPPGSPASRTTSSTRPIRFPDGFTVGDIW